MPCCLLLLFWLVLILCCILFWIPNSLILLIVPNGNPNKLTSFADFLRFISCVLLYIICMISNIKMNIKMNIKILNITTTILQVETRKIIQWDNKEYTNLYQSWKKFEDCAGNVWSIWNIMEKYHADHVNDNSSYYCSICLVYLDILFKIEHF